MINPNTPNLTNTGQVTERKHLIGPLPDQLWRDLKAAAAWDGASILSFIKNALANEIKASYDRRVANVDPFGEEE